MSAISPHTILQLEINDVTRAWGLEVDRVELAVEAVLQLPQDSPAGPSLDSTLQQLALHFLGGGMSSVAGGAPLPEPGKEPRGKSEGAPQGAQFGVQHRLNFATCSLNQAACAVHTPPSCSGHPDSRADQS